ncbi:MAG: LysM peptidoglycan-binding domain-containing protein [Dokdonella sp.]
MRLATYRTWWQLAATCLLSTLAACSVVEQRPIPAKTTQTLAKTTQNAEREAGVGEPAPPSTTNPLTPWQRLRQRFALPGCDYSDAVIAEARRYTRQPKHFSNNWRDAMPLLLLVLERIERHDLPGEFALLPYVESHYRQLPARSNGAAGMWQLMGRTAVDHGLRVGRDHDERLDALAATDVAIELIERYDREFGDWRAADLAFNAGEFRVKRALAGRQASDLSAEDLAHMKLSATTHQHLVRLIALACIIKEPQRFGVTLPDVDPAAELKEVALPVAIDLRLAAALAELPLTDLFRFNPTWIGQPSQSGPAIRLLLPTANVDRFNEALAYIPGSSLGAWHVQRMESPTSLDELATVLNTDPSVLALANRLERGSSLLPGQTLLLPGVQTSFKTGENIGETHTIKTGDTLSAIAHRYGVSLKNLLHWNTLTNKSILRTGSTLRIQAPSP